jgi:4-amino-4-deoxy-L-arabinose transferase-like glycosyltransferase
VLWGFAIFGIATLARVAGQLALNAYAHPRVFEYEEIARNLIAGRGYTYASPDGGIYVASQSSPLYIVLTAGVYWLTDGRQAAMLALQAVLGGVTAVLCYWLVTRVWSRQAGIVAGMLVALDPALVVYAAELHSLALDAFANVALLCANVALPVRPSMTRLAGLGALFGAAALTRATALLMLVPVFPWLHRYRSVRTMVGFGVIVVAAAVVYSPWPIRNTLLLGQVTLGSSETSEWLWRGNNPDANGSSLTTAGQRMIEVAPPEFRARIDAAGETIRMDLYRDAALSFIRAQPGAALSLYVTKLRTFWWGSDVTGLLYPQAWLAAYRLWYVVLVLAAVWGVAQSISDRAQRSTVLLIAAMLAVVSVTQAIFYVEGRHRITVEPLILMLSAVGAVAFAHQLARWRSGRIVPTQVAARDPFQPDAPIATLPE